MHRTTFRQQPKPERQPTVWPGVQHFAPEVRCDGAAVAQPIPVQHRNPHLLAMARDKSCQLQIFGVCNGNPRTTVAAHSNFGIHGKAKSRKADDCYVVNACSACHAWLDQGPAPKAQKEAAFMAGHLRQVLAWRVIASDSRAPAADRKAVTWALELLNASFVGEAP